MKRGPILILIGILSSCNLARADPPISKESEWITEQHGEDGILRKLLVGKELSYSFATGPGAIEPEKVTRIHQFYLGDKLALKLMEHDNQEDVYFGIECTSYPEAGVQTNTWDYNKDGVIDVVKIGTKRFFGRFKDGVFGHVPLETNMNFTELWDYLKKHTSEQGGGGKGEQRR